MWVFVAAVSGGVAGLVGYLAGRGQHKNVRVIVVVVLMLVLNAIGQRFIVKPYEADKALRELPAFQSIRQHDPETYRAVRADVMQSMNAGANHTAIRQRVRGHVTKMLSKYAPRASDQSLHNYSAVMVDEIEEIARNNPREAVRFVFPAAGEFVDISTLIAPATKQRDLAALSEVIESGAKSGAVPVDEQRANSLLQREIEKLSDKYGDDIAVLSKPRDPESDPAMVSQIVVDLYRAILALPRDESSVVVRHILTTETQ